MAMGLVIIMNPIKADEVTNKQKTEECATGDLSSEERSPSTGH